MNLTAVLYVPEINYKKTIQVKIMRRLKFLMAVMLAVLLMLPGCELVIDIIATGVVIGIIIAILIIALIIWGITKFIDL